MMQSRTHTCGQLRIENAGERVTLVGWMENVRVVGNNFAFIVLRDFYGTTQIVVETEEIMNIVKPCLSLIPFVLILSERRFKTAGKYLLLYGPDSFFLF